MYNLFIPPLTNITSTPPLQYLKVKITIAYVSTHTQKNTHAYTDIPTSLVMKKVTQLKNIYMVILNYLNVVK